MLVLLICFFCIKEKKKKKEEGEERERERERGENETLRKYFIHKCFIKLVIENCVNSNIGVMETPILI